MWVRFFYLALLLFTTRPLVAGARLYMRVERPPAEVPVHEDDVPLELVISSWAETVSKLLQTNGDLLMAYRLGDVQNDPFVSLLQPTHVLVVRLRALRTNEKPEDVLQTENVAGQKVTQVQKQWVTRGQLEMDARLESDPPGRPAKERRITISQSQAYETESGDERRKRTQSMITGLFDAAITDLSKSVLSAQKSTASLEASSWFPKTIAVLPFSDPASPLEGPLNIRRLTRLFLQQSGYTALAPVDVDYVLREHGLTVDVALNKARPEDLARWLQVDFLLYGDVKQFDEFNRGATGWKRLEGSYRLWSATERREIWRSDKKVSRWANEPFRKMADMGWSFLSDLPEPWKDKIKSQPLAEEAAYFVQQHLAELPHLPQKKEAAPGGKGEPGAAKSWAD